MHNSYIEANKANCGGGIFIENNSNCIINYSSLIRNTAKLNGGAICINDLSNLTINKFNSMNYNTAKYGIDIYNCGILELYSFNVINGGIYLCTDKNTLKIRDTLDDSKIVIEKSNHINPEGNKSILSIANTTDNYPKFNNYDINSINIPTELFSNWELSYNDNKDEIFLKDTNTYNITYNNTMDVYNPNPKSYTVEDLPIILKPLEKENYKFINWTNIENIPIHEIPANIRRDIILNANWSEIKYVNINYDSNTKDIVNDMPKNSKTEIGSDAIINNTIPKRRGYIFLNWNTKQNDSGIKIYSNQEVKNINEDITLYAIWYRLPYICCSNPVYTCICCKYKRKLCKCKNKKSYK